MKMSLIFLLFMALLGGTKLGFVRDVMGQEPFIMYERDIEWKHEIFYLDNFAAALIKHPDTIGYIIVYDGKSDSGKALRSHVLRIQRYLGRVRKIPKNRLVPIYAAQTSSTIILQPLDRSLPPPNPQKSRP